MSVGTVSAAAISWALGYISADNRDSEEAEEVSVSSSESIQGSAIKATLGNLFSSASELGTPMTEVNCIST